MKSQSTMPRGSSGKMRKIIPNKITTFLGQRLKWRSEGKGADKTSPSLISVSYWLFLAWIMWIMYNNNQMRMTLGSGAACHKSLLTFLGWTAKPSGNATDCSVITQSYQCVLFTVIWWTSRILNFSFQIVSSLVFTEVWHQKPSLLSGLHWVLPEISLKIRGLGSLTRQLRCYHAWDCSYIYI